MGKLELLRSAAELVLYFCGWFGPSIGLTLFNKWFLHSWREEGFRFPIFVTCCHFFMNCVWSLVLISLCHNRFPVPDPQQLTWRGYCKSIVPIGVGTALDIVLSNQAYLYMPVTLMTIVKSAGPLFLLLWAFALRLETPTVRLVGVIVVIMAGSGLAVVDFSNGADASPGSPESGVTAGIVMLVLALVASGGRWGCTQLLLQAGFTKMHPVVALRYTAPVCLATLLPGFLIIEAKQLFSSEWMHETSTAITVMTLIVLSSFMALVLILAEFALIQRYSAITMTVGGVVKELLTITMAVTFLKETLAWNNLVGAVVVIIAVLYYTYLKTGVPSQPSISSRANQENLFQTVQYKSTPTVAMPIPKLELSIEDDVQPVRVEVQDARASGSEDAEALQLLAMICDKDEEHSAMGREASPVLWKSPGKYDDI